MQRRDFLTLSGFGIAQVLSSCVSRSVRGAADSDPYGALVAQNDARIPALIARQQRETSHPCRGGIADRHGLYRVGAAAGLLRDLAAAWAAPESRYAKSNQLVERMHSAAHFLTSRQHDDGTIDLVTTNFHSPPDTAFVLEWVCAATSVLRGTDAPELAPLLAELDRFILGGAEALRVGGIHTPNHRWVVCMGLARANALHPNAGYVARIDEWLREKIDIDPDGQFAERSSSIYSPLTDRCLITMARLLDRPALLDPVRKNLEMTLYYVHADGEVVTESSRRQDQYRPGSLAPYYLPYRYLALREDNGRFARLARWIEQIALGRLTGNLIFLLEDPSLRRPLPAEAPLPADYERHFAHSRLVRVRRGASSATILAENPTFFSLHKGSAVVVMRFAAAFFGKGQFVGTELRKDGSCWRMHQELTGPYYQPLPAEHRPPDGDWSKMPRDLRSQSEVQRLRSEVRVREAAGGFQVEIRIGGTEHVPVAVELGFRRGGALAGVARLPDVPDAYLLHRGRGRFRFGGATIEFGPGGASHRWTQLRGALPKLDADCVYLTGETPFHRTLLLR